MNTRNTVTHRDDRADFADINSVVVVLDLLPEDCCYLICPNLSHKNPFFETVIETLVDLQALPKNGELPTYRTVVNFGTDLRRHATDQAGVH